MLTLNIEAPSFPELVQKAFQALGVSVGAAAPATVQSPPATATEPSVSPGLQSEAPAGGGSTAADTPPRKRGRPRKEDLPPAGAPQAEVGNTVSAPAVAGLAAEDASTPAPAVPPAQAEPGAAVASFDEVRTALQAASQRFKDWNVGAQHVCVLIGKYGYKLVREMKDAPPEQLAKIVAEAVAIKGDA